MVWTFYAPRQILVLGPSRLSVVLLTSRGLSSEVLIRPVGWLKSATGSEVVVAFIVVSVTESFYGVESLTPCPTPNLEDQVLILVWALPCTLLDLVEPSRYSAQGSMRHASLPPRRQGNNILNGSVLFTLSLYVNMGILALYIIP